MSHEKPDNVVDLASVRNAKQELLAGNAEVIQEIRAAKGYVGMQYVTPESSHLLSSLEPEKQIIIHRIMDRPLTTKDFEKAAAWFAKNKISLQDKDAIVEYINRIDDAVVVNNPAAFRIMYLSLIEREKIQVPESEQ